MQKARARASSPVAQVPEDEAIVSFTGDGAYDTQPVYEAVMQRGAVPVSSPRKIWKSGVATTGEVWWNPRCTASSDWANV